MAFARYGHSATILQDGRVLITGGLTELWPGFKATQTAEIYDPASGTFMLVGEMAVAIAGHSATLLPNGKVLITGGGTAAAELFDTATDSFTPAGSTSSKYVDTATLLVGGRVLITGETNIDLSAAPVSELYDPLTGGFAPTGTTATLHIGCTATLLPNGTVMIAGGEVPVAIDSSPGAYLPTPVSSTEIYTPATNSFSPGPALKQERVEHSATLLRNGTILIVGGFREGYSYEPSALASAEVY